VLLQPAAGKEASVLYSGDQLVNPLDIDVSLDGETLYVADPAAGPDGEGALVTISVSGGEPRVALAGRRPRSVTVGPDGTVYFSGISDETAEPGVFVLNGDTASALFVGAPLIDPSGIAAKANGDVLVADTRLFDGAAGDATAVLSSEAGIVLIHDGAASIFATGFATGYPAGIALTSDEKSLIVSGEGPDRSDTVYVFDATNPKLPPTVVTDSFSAFQDSSAGLKRSHQGNTFIWASLAVNGGTIYRIEGH
jgi:DNA-binding beta-propeller fold protein YncE